MTRTTPQIDVDLIDRADRVRLLLEFVAGYTLLVDACEDGATVDQLKTGYLGIPLLEAADVVQELEDAVRVQDVAAEPDLKPVA